VSAYLENGNAWSRANAYAILVSANIAAQPRDMLLFDP